MVSSQTLYHLIVSADADPRVRTYRSLAQFTAKAGSAVDSVKSFDRYLVRELDNLAQEQVASEKRLVRRALAAIGPLAGFSAFDRTEQRVKELLVTAMDRTAEKIAGLIRFADALAGKLDKIQEVLHHIQATAVDEIGKVPAQDALKALWVLLAQPGDQKYLRRAHETQLKDITRIYAAALGVVRGALAGLHHAQAGLDESKIQSADPGLLLHDYPLVVIADKFKHSIRKLEASREERALLGDQHKGSAVRELPTPRSIWRW
jgi:hypothetical protein